MKKKRIIEAINALSRTMLAMKDIGERDSARDVAVKILELTKQL